MAVMVRLKRAWTFVDIVMARMSIAVYNVSANQAIRH